MSKQVFRERECIHRELGCEGEFYNGVFYVQALRRLPVDTAVETARKVAPFFWADSEHIIVWLCHKCACELNLTETPRSLMQGQRKQA